MDLATLLHLGDNNEWLLTIIAKSCILESVRYCNAHREKLGVLALLLCKKPIFWQRIQFRKSEVGFVQPLCKIIHAVFLILFSVFLFKEIRFV